ncbi:tRNA (guanosine(37)-N1)-methyltransferase TrmD [bacterium]|nr:tRNA (guanosine(37)-N1)-methyltransferase TrmD [bacterium]
MKSNNKIFQSCAITLFPNFFEQFVETSLIQKAVREHLFRFSTLNPRDFAPPPHHHVDDIPYGGGAGMVMRPEPLVAAIEEAKKKLHGEGIVIAPSAAGKPFTQQKAKQLAQSSGLIFLCGRYEGIDQRVLDHFVDEEISIGDYVLMGGEVPVMVILEAVLRLRSGVLGNPKSLNDESHSEQGYLEAPQYTRPEDFRGHTVPEVLRSGDHQAILQWRNVESQKRKKDREE